MTAARTRAFGDYEMSYDSETYHHSANDARDTNAQILAMKQNAIDRLESHEPVYTEREPAHDGVEPNPPASLLSQIRDEVLRTIRAESAFDEAPSEGADDASLPLKNSDLGCNMARADLLSAASWCNSASPQEALFQLSAISDFVERMLEAEPTEQWRLRSATHRMLHSVAYVIEKLAPGVTLEREGLGFFFLSRRCDPLRRLRTAMAEAPQVSGE